MSNVTRHGEQRQRLEPEDVARGSEGEQSRQYMDGVSWSRDHDAMTRHTSDVILIRDCCNG